MMKQEEYIQQNFAWNFIAGTWYLYWKATDKVVDEVVNSNGTWHRKHHGQNHYISCEGAKRYAEDCAYGNYLNWEAKKQEIKIKSLTKKLRGESPQEDVNTNKSEWTWEFHRSVSLLGLGALVGGFLVWCTQ